MGGAAPSYLKYDPLTGDFLIAKTGLVLPGDNGRFLLLLENIPQYKLFAFRDMIKHLNLVPPIMSFDDVEYHWKIFDVAFTLGEEQPRPINQN